MWELPRTVRRGCPARAGIGPNPPVAVIAISWLPRASGDRPDLADGAVSDNEVAPRERG